MVHLKDSSDLGHEAREGYDKLIEHMPECAIEKLGALNTPTERFAALTSLCRKHSGELVAVDHTRDYWRLMQVDQRYFSWHWGEQFFAMEGGQCVADALPGFARSAERAQEHKQWGRCLEGQQDVHMTMSTGSHPPPPVAVKQTAAIAEDRSIFCLDCDQWVRCRSQG